jgi:HEAT repeat protein
VTSRLSRALDSDDVDARRFSIGFLGRLSALNPEALAAILRARDSESGRARNAALIALSHADHQDSSVIKSLTDALGDADANIRRSAVDSLAVHCNTSALPSLLRALEDSDWEVQMSAAVGLARLGQVTEPVISILIGAHGSQTLPAQRASAKVLVELGRTNDQVLAALLRQLDGYLHAEDAAVRLGEIGRATDEVLAGLVRALQHENPRARVEGARSLAKLGRVRDDIVTGLVQALNKDDELIAAAAEALGKLHQSQDEVVCALERVLIAKSHGGEIVMRHAMPKLSARKAAARNLGLVASENPAALSVLLRAVDHKPPQPQEDPDFYLEMLQRQSSFGRPDYSKYVKTAAAFGLAHVSDPGDETIAALVRALDDADIFVKQAAAEALMQLGRATEPGIEALKRTMDHHDHDVWRAAAVSLMRLGAFSEDLIGNLLSKAQERSGFDRDAAISWLGELRMARRDIVETLCRALRIGTWGALSSLGMLDWKKNSENLRPVLIALNRAYYDANPYYRGSVLETLRKLLVVGAHST